METDALIACFDSKYAYTFWRPVTAIRNAAIDGNPATTPDPTWAPLLTTPNHPEYPAAHGCATSALARAMAAALGTKHLNVDIPGATGGGTTLTTSRHYNSVGDLEREIVNARVWAGLHYRGSGEAGVDIGRDVARWALQRYFRPAHAREASDAVAGE
jgi:vanadium-dependent haloperoxidase-like protein